jgi:hypothetical protein
MRLEHGGRERLQRKCWACLNAAPPMAVLKSEGQPVAATTDKWLCTPWSWRCDYNYFRTLQRYNKAFHNWICIIADCNIMICSIELHVQGLPVGIATEDVFDDDDGFLNHIVDFVSDQLQKHVDAAFCGTFQGDSTLPNCADSLQCHHPSIDNLSRLISTFQQNKV